jgi:ACS family tartrate transporter-like MFS transporter
MTATQIAGVVGGPLSGLLLSMNGVWHLAGWQWLFLAEGIPAVLLGVIAAIYLPDGPEQASWLSSTERSVLTRRLEFERDGRTADHTLSAALSNPIVWLLALLYFALVFGHSGSLSGFPRSSRASGASVTSASACFPRCRS